MKKLFIFIFIFTNLLFARQLDLSATVISDNEKIISSRFMGFIKKIHVSEGDIVKKGSLLYEIDSIEIDSKKEQAKLNIDIYKNQFDNVKLNYERYKRLFEKGLVSKFDLEQLELKYSTLQSTLKIADARLKEIENQYKYLKIKSPNNAMVIKKSIKEGEMSIPGVPSIILTDLSNLKIKTEISESDLKNIKKGMEVSVIVDSIGYESKGKIDSIIPNTNSMTHTFILKISFKKDENILPGMYAKVLIDIKE